MTTAKVNVMNWKNEALSIIHDIPRKRILPKKPKERKKTIRIYLTAIIIFIAMSWLITFINYLRG